MRALLADGVRLDLVSRRKAAGRREVGTYFSNHESAGDRCRVPGWLDGREVLWVLPREQASAPRYFVELTWTNGRVATIRDFRHGRYIAKETKIELVQAARDTLPI